MNVKIIYFLVLLCFVIMYPYPVYSTITYNPSTNTITVIGDSTCGNSESNPCSFEDIYQTDQSNGWNVVYKQNDDQYYFECKLNIGDGTTETWLIDTKKAISFTLVDNFITIKNYGHLRCGEVISESKRTTKDGCYFYSSAPATKKLIYVESHGTLELYSSLINSKAYLQISSSEINKIWNSVITGPYCSGYPTPQVNIYNVLWSSAQYGIQMIPINASDVTIANCYYGMYLKAMRSNYNISNFKMIDETYSFRTYNFNGNLYAIDTDCKWTFYWGYASSGKVYRQYTFVPKIVDENNNPIENAEIFLLNNKGEQQFNETTDSNGEISEQTVTHGYYIKDTSNTLNTEEPHTLYIRKYGYIFKTITKQFTARTEETIVLDKNEFLDLTEAEALALTGISYTPPTKVNYGDEVHTNFTTTGQLDHYPICQAEYFAIFGYDGTYDNVLLNRVDGTPSNEGEYNINFATGEITFFNNQSGHDVKPVYSYGGKITLTNGGSGSELTMSQVYAYLQALKTEVIQTINGKDYIVYIDLQIGSDTTMGSLEDPDSSITFKEGYGYNFGSAGGFIDLYAVTGASGVSVNNTAIAQAVWEYANRTLTDYNQSVILPQIYNLSQETYNQTKKIYTFNVNNIMNPSFVLWLVLLCAGTFTIFLGISRRRISFLIISTILYMVSAFYSFNFTDIIGEAGVWVMIGLSLIGLVVSFVYTLYATVNITKKEGQNIEEEW